MKEFYSILAVFFALFATTTTAQPGNDNCANPVVISLGNTCVVSNYTSIGATAQPTTVAANPSCGFYQGGDVWFTFQAPASGNFRIETNNLSTGSANWTLYQGSCGVFTEITCNSINGNFSNPPLGGQTLYLRVFRINSAAGNDFSLCVWETTPPTNNACANAIPLGVTNTSAPVNYSSQLATTEPASVAPNPSCGFYLGGDVWFTFTAPLSGNFRIELANLSAGAANWTMYSGTCGNFTEVACNSTNSNFNNSAFGGQTYYLRFFRINSNQGIDFSLSVWETTPPANDFCSNAIMLAVPLECTPQNFSNQYSTAEPLSVAPNPTCGFYQGGDVWFKFVIPLSGSFRLETTNISAGAANWAIFSGSCGNFSQLFCSSTNTNFVEPTWANQTLYLRVYRINSNQGNDFSLCIWETVVPPTNDLCANAIDLSVGVSCIPQPYTSQLTTAEPISIAANPSCGFYQGGDAWFTFEVPASGNFRIELANTSAGAANFVVYTGSCGNFSELFCSSTNKNYVRPDLAGQVLYLRVFRINSLQGNNFTLCIWEIEPPVNDNCVNAIDLTVNDECVATAFSSQYSVAEPGSAPNPTCGFFNGGDVWFKFTAPASGNFSIQKTSVGNGISALALYAGGCGNFTEVLCSSNNITTVTNPLIGGQVVYIRVYRFNSDQGSDFTLCIRATDTAANNNCVDAISLGVGSSCNLVTFDNFNTSSEPGVAAAPGCAPFSGSDVWFVFDLPASGQAVINLAVISGGEFAAVVYSGACGAFTEIDCASNGDQIVLNDPSLSSQTLYLRVYRVSSLFGGQFSVCIVSGDCIGVAGGSAFFDECGTCVGGTTGLQPCVEDCAGVFGGTAFIDDCDTCAGGTTNVQPCAGCSVNGGVLSTSSPRLNLCVGDGKSNQVVLNVTANVGLGRFGLVKQSDLSVVASNATGVFNMENLPAGNYFAGHVSVNELVQIQGTINVDQLSGCFDLSNQLAVTSIQLNGGLIQAVGSTGICGGSLSFTVVGKAGPNFRWALLNQTGTTVISQNNSGTFNFSALPAGSYRVVHIAFGNGVNLGTIVPPLLPECVAASNQIAVTLNSCAANLYSNPNPVSTIADVSFNPAVDSEALLEVYDMSGRLVSTLMNGAVQGGLQYKIQFDSSALPNGVYLYRLTTSEHVYTEKFLKVK